MGRPSGRPFLAFESTPMNSLKAAWNWAHAEPWREPPRPKLWPKDEVEALQLKNARPTRGLEILAAIIILIAASPFIEPWLALLSGMFLRSG